MPQLVSFFFNQVTFVLILLLIILYVFSKYILPRFVRLFLTRVFISKLYNQLFKSSNTRFFANWQHTINTKVLLNNISFWTKVLLPSSLVQNILVALLLLVLSFIITASIFFNFELLVSLGGFSGFDFSSSNFLTISILEPQVQTYEMPMPGVRCPNCLRQGIEQWVTPGKHCPRCKTAC